MGHGHCLLILFTEYHHHKETNEETFHVARHTHLLTKKLLAYCELRYLDHMLLGICNVVVYQLVHVEQFEL